MGSGNWGGDRLYLNMIKKLTKTTRKRFDKEETVLRPGKPRGV